jgi:hypothetical protein
MVIVSTGGGKVPDRDELIRMENETIKLSREEARTKNEVFPEEVLPAKPAIDGMVLPEDVAMAPVGTIQGGMNGMVYATFSCLRPCASLTPPSIHR